MQTLLFQNNSSTGTDSKSSTFQENMALAVHRWFRFSAGFSSLWAEHVLSQYKNGSPVAVLDPFAGSGTTLLAAERVGIRGIGIEAHPFIARIAKAKLQYRSDSRAYSDRIDRVLATAAQIETPTRNAQPELLARCFKLDTLDQLERLRWALAAHSDETPSSELAWLTLVSILRQVSHVGTAPWQYVLPNKTKRKVPSPFVAFKNAAMLFSGDMRGSEGLNSPRAELIHSDARTCEGVQSHSIDLVITSPPYANNYDYADAMRLEMTFMGEITSWGDLRRIRESLIRSCSQHVPENSVHMEEVVSAPELEPIRREIASVCRKLSLVRQTRGGRKTYHNMVACYFLDMARTWQALRRVCRENSTVCFVVGDSAPYGIYVPVMEWLGSLAVGAGFSSYRFEKLRDRNTKWKNRKHRVPLAEGRLWVQG